MARPWLWALTLLVPLAGRAAAPEPPGYAVASAHPLATAAGSEILATGGNAFDAAVAVAAALAVVEPYSSGLGGGGFWLLHRASDGQQVMLDGRETAPGAAHARMYQSPAGEVLARRSVDGPLAAGVPGVPAALDHLGRRYGRLPLARSLAPAIRLARKGFTVTLRYHRLAAFRRQALLRSPAASAVFLDHGRVPETGYRIRQVDLARVLETLAVRGAAGFYRGPVAEALVQGVRRAGGSWTRQDLEGYRVIERPPVQADYHGLRVVSAAPPSSGGVALATMLNILAADRLSALGGVARKHLVIEAMRLAYRDRAEYLGDPDFVPIPVARLGSLAYARGLRAGIRLDRARPSATLRPAAVVPGGDDTTHYSILDAQGNRVAATLSINYPFGSAFMPPGTGVLLNDEMDDFSAKPGVPNLYGLVGGTANAVAPGKRPLSSMSPTFVEGAGGVAILGTPGGSRIISMVLLAILDLADGHGPASWVRLPRFHHQYLPDEVQYEPGALSEDEARGLRALGHHLRPLARPYGNMQAVYWDQRRGTLTAASDPRGEGASQVRSHPSRATPQPAGDE